MKLHFSMLTLASFAVVTACGDEETPQQQSEPQPIEFFQGSLSAALGAPSNEADCALCHSSDGSTNGTNGDSLMDIAYKSSFKGNGAPNLLAACNACVTGWMGGEALTEDDPRWTSLESYLQSISSESATEPNPLTPEVLADEAAYEAEYAGGDAAAGESTYNNYCGRCHSGSLTLGQTPSFPLASIASRSVGRIAQKVRTSGPPPSGMNDASDTTPGPMPFFEPDELSTTDLRNIIAYLKAQSQ